MRIKKFADLDRIERSIYIQSYNICIDRYIADVAIEDEKGRLDFRGCYLRGFSDDNLEDCLWKFAVDEAMNTEKEAEVNLKVDLNNKKIIITIETDIGVRTYTIYRINRIEIFE